MLIYDLMVVKDLFFFFFQAEDGIRDIGVTGVQTCALPISGATRTEFFDVVGTEDAAAGTPMQTADQVITTALTTLDRRTPPPSVVSGRRNQIGRASCRERV